MNTPRGYHRPSPQRGAHRGAFTLIELLVAVSCLTLLMVILSQLLNSAAIATLRGNKHMDADSQTRALFDRMAIDFSQLLKRTDVDCWLKHAVIRPQPGNDQLAFFANVPGYFTASSGHSPLSLVSYRINSSTLQAERMGLGLYWNATATPSPTHPTLVFGDATIPTLAPAAIDSSASHSSYEAIAPQIFRMEYYYLLREQKTAAQTFPAIPSETPWDVRVGHTALNGWQDVSAIAVVVAVIDPKSRLIVSDTALKNLSATLVDFAPTMKPGELETQWNAAVSAAITNLHLPSQSASSIMVQRRFFYLTPSPVQ